jgi:hypothetical protein
LAWELVQNHKIAQAITMILGSVKEVDGMIHPGLDRRRSFADFPFHAGVLAKIKKRPRKPGSLL